MQIPLIGRLFKAAPNRNDGDAPRSPLGSWRGNKRPIVDYKNAFAAEKALEHPIVFRCLHKIAMSVQQVRWYAEPDPDVVASERTGPAVIKALNALLDSPNDTLAPDQLRYWMAMNYACYGRVPFKVGVGVNSTPNGIYPLAVPYVRARLNTRGQIIAYEYGSLTDKEELPVRKKASATGSYISEIVTPNLMASLESGKNINALGAIGLPSQVAEMLLHRAHDTASGHPNMKYIVTSEKTLTKAQRDAIKEHIEDAAPGGEESGNILFLYNTAVEVHKLDNDLKDIHSKMPLDDMSRMIAGAFGIPISLLGLGAADGAKFAGNYIESRQSFWEDTIIPGYCTPIATGLTMALCPYGARIRFDLDTIDAIQDSRTGRAMKLEKVAFLTNDEKRELAGYPPLTPEQRAQLDREAAMRAPRGNTPSETPANDGANNTQ